MAVDRPLWKLKYQDPSWDEPRTYTFDPQKELTVGRLRQIKEWYGPEVGRYLAFIQAFAQGDPEAALAALWIVRTTAGESDVPEPDRMPDFSMGDFYAEFIPAGEEPEAEKDPTQPSAQAPTTESTETPTSSEQRTSVSSPQSADSGQRKSTS